MSVVREYLKVLIGIGLTWACVFILFNGMAHATLDGWAFVFSGVPTRKSAAFMSAPIAQSHFYILARKTSWLLNTYLVISLICCPVAGCT
jgi:hypothetical protein